MITLTRLKALLAAFPDRAIGLVGDLFLDRYLEIDARRTETSIETGLDAYQVVGVRNSPGALGTVMNNLAALGVGRLVPVTVIGDDGHAHDLLHALADLPVDVEHVFKESGRLTPTYTKPMITDTAGPPRELNRLDLRTRAPLTPATEQAILESLTDVFHQTDGLIVVDQIPEPGCGVVTPAVRERLAELGARHPEKLILVDSRANAGAFRQVVLKPNLAECLAAVGRPADEAEGLDETLLAAAAEELAARTERPLFCTLGQRGMLVVRPDVGATLVPAYPANGLVDIVGAGDSATAGIVAARLAGGDWIESAAVGNLVASITVAQLGTTGTATPAQVIAHRRESADE